jgi:Restriction endonuclease
MGYGGSLADAGRAIGRTGDGGVDVVIKEDKLGLDVLYIQAKSWDNTTVGSPEIPKFYGVGVAAVHSYAVKRIDSDFFGEEDEPLGLGEKDEMGFARSSTCPRLPTKNLRARPKTCEFRTLCRIKQVEPSPNSGKMRWQARSGAASGTVR